MVTMKVDQTDLNIIILNYNGKLWLEKLLFTLHKNYLAYTRYNVEVTVVDNGSKDDSVGFVSTLEWVKLIESGMNGGFAFGNNIALKESKSRYSMLLNSDTEIPETGNNPDLLIEYMDKDDKIAVITPKLILDNGLMDAACHRGEPTIWASLCYYLRLEKIFPGSVFLAKYHQTYKNLRSIHKIDACSGAAMLVRNSAMEEIGLLDEQFFMYAEDLDWCRRFREKGYDIIFYPDVTIFHHKYKSGIQSKKTEISAESRKWFYEAMLKYYDKYYSSNYHILLRGFLSFFVEVNKRR